MSMLENIMWLFSVQDGFYLKQQPQSTASDDRSLIGSRIQICLLFFALYWLDMIVNVFDLNDLSNINE